MATNYCNAVDEEFIDIELISSSNLFFYSTNPSFPLPQAKEFEFQMSSSISNDFKESDTSPADELFYKGKLLPLHLPPRLQMLQNILQHPIDNIDTSAMIPHSKTNKIISGKPLDQLHDIAVQDQTCRISFEIGPNEYLFEHGAFNEQPKKEALSKKKLNKVMKKSSIVLKLEASRAYVKSLFSRKSGYSDESCVAAAKKVPEKLGKFATDLMHGIDYKEGLENNECSSNKLCLEEKINECPKMSCSFSSSFSSYQSVSFGSNGSANTEIDTSIEAAIDYCNKSRKFSGSNDESVVNDEDGFLSFSVSRNGACSWELERPGLIICSI